MKKLFIGVLLLLAVSSGMAAVEAGTGFSLFFPESFYDGSGGTVSVDFLYRDLKADLNMSGSYDVGPIGGPYATTVLSEADAKLVIRGFSLGLGGSFAF